MDKNSAAQLIKEVFQNPFNKERFVFFVRNLLNHFTEAPFIYRGNFIPDAYDSYIKTLERIGKYEDPEGNKIDILIVNLKKEKSLEHARTMQRNFIAWYLNGSRGGIQKDAALVAFVSPKKDDWRFSLVKMEYKLTETQKGRIKAKEELTPAKRFSFLVGEHESSHTAQSRLVPILEDDVNNPTLKQLEESFSIEKVTKEFFEKYHKLYLKVKEILDELVNKDLAIKNDFNQKGLSTVDFAKKLLGQIVFLYFLQKKGWFGVKRGKKWGTGSKNFLRELFNKEHGSYKNFFNDILEPLFYEALRQDRSYDDDYYSRFDCRIPFLNGGLFDPLNNYDWVNTDIFLPNEFFSNEEKTKEGDVGTGILDIFDRYNFTVKEDEPLEKEVAVDPEMLGKVFENLLEVKDRKSKGTYYTPREIVHYMCQESLVDYLEAETNIDKEKLNLLVHFDQFMAQKMPKTKRLKAVAMWEGEVKEIEESLGKIRIVDPACGSGAFLVGMMQEIIGLKKILSLFFKTNNLSNYQLKLQSIQNNLYGVDIDLGAVEIAKLRLWLSLVVDEEDIKQIKPLPNLDYKIVCGDSLLGVEKNLFNASLFSKLEKLKPLFFNETNAKKKQEYKNQIDELINQITNGRKDFDFEVYFSEIFHENGGFDIVIGNPPYDVYEGHRKKEIEVINKMPIYEKAKGGKLNAYKVFLAKSIELQKDNGTLCEIFQNSFLADNSATKIRKFFLENQRIIKIDSFPERDDINRRVFEGVKMSVCILFSHNISVDSYSFQLRIWEDKYMNSSREVILNNQDILRFEPQNAPIPSLSTKEYQLLKKLSKTTRLREIAHCFEGEINLTFHKKYLHKGLDGNTPMIKGAAVQKWFITPKMSQGEIEYIDADSYLRENQSPKSKHFEKERIVMQGITGVDEKMRLKMAIIDSGTFCGNSVNYIVFHSNSVAQEYLLALLNSSFLNWYFKAFSTNSNVNGYEVDNLPILITDKQKPFINLVNKILAITKDDDYLENPAKQAKVRDYEKQIDQMVYKLYGLTPEEIKIVESKLIL